MYTEYIFMIFITVGNKNTVDICQTKKYCILIQTYSTFLCILDFNFG